MSARHVVKFDGTILFLGLGSVGSCAIQLLSRFVQFDAKKLIIMDALDRTSSIPKDLLEKGAKFVQHELDGHNFREILSKYVTKGDIILDLSISGTTPMFEWCWENEIRVISTSMEEWEEEEMHKEDKRNLDKMTLYGLHMELRDAWQKAKAAAPEKQFVTTILSHGMNPGLVSHFAKKGIFDIAQKIIDEKSEKEPERCAALKEAMKKREFGVLAQLIGLKVIHISERDSQITDKPKQMNEFVNTWSIDGFLAELVCRSEIGWGTHEQRMPQGSQMFNYGPNNMLVLPTKGARTWMRSWVPSGDIIGMAITHDEAFSLSDYLSVKQKGEDGKEKVVYRPTVHFVYMPTDCAISSVHELCIRQYDPNAQKRRVLGEQDILSGMDEVGVLLMGHDYKTWWVGSRLSIDTTKKLVTGQNATTLQVAISAVAAFCWAVENKYEGLCYPEKLPHEYILNICEPYLEPLVSLQSDWDPLKDRSWYSLWDYGDMFQEYPTPDDMWQFPTFLVDAVPLESCDKLYQQK